VIYNYYYFKWQRLSSLQHLWSLSHQSTHQLPSFTALVTNASTLVCIILQKKLLIKLVPTLTVLRLVMGVRLHSLETSESRAKWPVMLFWPTKTSKGNSTLLVFPRALFLRAISLKSAQSRAKFETTCRLEDQTWESLTFPDALAVNYASILTM